jgi:hypothetical protein
MISKLAIGNFAWSKILPKSRDYCTLKPLVKLVPYLAEQPSFLQTYKGTEYFNENATQYITEMNLQRGKWRDDTVNDFLGYDPPDETVYTGVSAHYYCLFFFILYAYQTLVIFIMKKLVSADFKNASFFDQILHSAESTNFAFSMYDWDFKKTGGPKEHYERMNVVRTEIVLNILINLTANLILLTPLSYLCKYNKYSKTSKMTNFGTGHLQKSSFSSYY